MIVESEDGNYSNLPEEIIIEILSWVPARSVGRFRCVSKTWRALLSEPQFIRTHLNRSKTFRPESLMFISNTRQSLFSAPLSNAHHLFDKISIVATKLSFADDYSDCWTRVCASSDGLLLAGDNKGNKFVLNPVTREIRKVPISPFALSPRYSSIMYGLGYDSVGDDYKVVSLSYYDTDGGYEPVFVNVYSLKNGFWKKTRSYPYGHAVGHVTPGASVNGCIHWLASRATDHKSAIVGFDLAEEKVREVPHPSSIESDEFASNQLAVLGGCLCMFGKSVTDVWVMKEYGVKESWTTFTIDNCGTLDIRPLCMLGQEEIVVKDNDKLVVCNLKPGTRKDIVAPGIQHDFLPETSFVESLVSPYGSNKAWMTERFHCWGLD